jgi:hypothetical protein
LNAILSAGHIPYLAACVVLTFAFVAIFIPINQAKAEQTAPTINEREMNQDDISVLAVTHNKIAIKNTKIAKILYSAFKNAIAHFSILFAIFCISSFQGSFFEIDLERANT